MSAWQAKPGRRWNYRPSDIPPCAGAPRASSGLGARMLAAMLRPPAKADQTDDLSHALSAAAPVAKAPADLLAAAAPLRKNIQAVADDGALTLARQMERDLLALEQASAQTIATLKQQMEALAEALLETGNVVVDDVSGDKYWHTFNCQEWGHSDACEKKRAALRLCGRLP